MSSDAKIQLNFKTRAGSLLNLYAQTAEEAKEQLDSLADLAGQIGEVEALLGAVSTVSTTLNSSGPNPQASAPAGTPERGGGPVCHHGNYEYKEGVSKSSGKPYKMWRCPSTDRNDQCKPTFIN